MRLIAFWLAAALLASPAAANLLTNGDFSNWDNPADPAGWTVEDTTKTTVSQVQDPVRSPGYSARLTRMIDSTGSNKGLSQYVAVTAGEAYTLIGWCFDSSSISKGGVSITWRKADSTYISNSGVSYTDSGTTGWQRLVKADTAPAEAGLAEVLVRIYNNGITSPAGGIVYFDDADFAQGLSVAEGRPMSHPRAADLRVQPNPVRGSGTVALSLSRAARARIDVYDMAGCCVAGVFAGSLPPGDHSFAFAGIDRDGRSLAAGLYFVVLSDDGGRSTVRKVVFEP